MKACRRRKFCVLDQIFLEVAKQLWSKPSRCCILFFLSLFPLPLCIRLRMCAQSWDSTHSDAQCVLSCSLNADFLLLASLQVVRASSSRQHLEFSLWWWLLPDEVMFSLCGWKGEDYVLVFQQVLVWRAGGLPPRLTGAWLFLFQMFAWGRKGKIWSILEKWE